MKKLQQWQVWPVARPDPTGPGPIRGWTRSVSVSDSTHLSLSSRMTFIFGWKNWVTLLTWREGATENAGVENAIREKMQGWKMQE